MKTRRFIPILLAGAAAALFLPAAAQARALVDDPAAVAAIPASAATYFAECNAEYQAWLAGRAAERGASALDAPWRILSTTSHKQIRNDYCVPATTTIMDHYLRGATTHWSQNRWAEYTYSGMPLWTDETGGNMWVMAMGLKNVTGSAYSYSSGNSTLSVYDRTEYGILQRGRPVAYGTRIIARDWPNYRLNHVGHIMAGRGFDWRAGVIYVDDPYPENALPPLGYGATGGDTYGQKTYPREIIAGGVLASASQQVVF